MLQTGTKLRRIDNGEIWTITSVNPSVTYKYKIKSDETGDVCTVNKQLKIFSVSNSPDFEVVEQEQKIVLRWKDVGGGYYITSHKGSRFMLATERIGSDQPEYVKLCEDGTQVKIGPQRWFMDLIRIM